MAKFPAHITMGWPEATWSFADDNAQNQPQPGAAEDAEFTSNSGKVVVTGPAQCASLTTVPGNQIEASAAYTLDVGGNITWGCLGDPYLSVNCGGSFEAISGIGWAGGLTKLLLDASAGATTITTNGVTFPPIEINNAGADSLTLQDDLTCSSFAYTDGDFDDGGHAVNVAGDIIFAAAVGGVTSTGTWTQAASGDVSSPSYGTRLRRLVVGGTGVASRFVGTVYCEEFTHGAGTVTDDSSPRQLTLVPGESDFWHGGPGELSIGHIYLCVSADLTCGKINASALAPGFGDAVSVAVSPTRTLTMTGDLDAGTNQVTVKAYATTGKGTLDMAGSRLTAAILKIGSDTEGYHGQVLLRDQSHEIGSISATKLDDTTGNALKLADCTQRLSGTLDGTKLTIDANGCLIGGGGTVQDVTLAAGSVCHAHGCIDGGGNSETVEFNQRQIGGAATL